MSCFRVATVLTLLAVAGPRPVAGTTCNQASAFQQLRYCDCGSLAVNECVEQLASTAGSSLAKFSTDASGDQTGAVTISDSATSFIEFMSGNRVRIMATFREEWGSGGMNLTVYANDGGYCESIVDLCPQAIIHCNIIYQQLFSFDLGDCQFGWCT